MKTYKRDLKNEIKSLKYAIAEKCVDCVCFQPMEVLKCEIDTCSLFKIRPKRLSGLYSMAKRLKRKFNKIQG